MGYAEMRCVRCWAYKRHNLPEAINTSKPLQNVVYCIAGQGGCGTACKMPAARLAAIARSPQIRLRWWHLLVCREVHSSQRSAVQQWRQH